jgi:hypothetical protein
MKINETDFKLIDKIMPAVAAGTYELKARQTVSQSGSAVAKYEATRRYAVTRRAFTVSTDEIFGIYPANGAAGNFAETLPYITLTDRSLPWAFGETPFVALIVLKNDEILGEADLTVKDLFAPVSNTYFPEKAAFPNCYAEDETELCHVVDISPATYASVFPKKADISLLAHAKLVDLSKSPDDTCTQDGYFSVIIANRFVPSDADNETASTCHLVTTFGYGGTIPADAWRIRLVSLHRWSVCSKSQSGRPFTELMNGLSKNCTEIGRGKPGKAAAVKPHYTRTGEMTYSIYHSPFLNAQSGEIPQLNAAHTADGRLIYDPQTGIFDVSYSAAFQLGRLITLNKPEIAAKVLAHRNDSKLKRHKAALDTVEKVDYPLIGKCLLDYEKTIFEKRRNSN